MNAIKLPFHFDPDKLLAAYNQIAKEDYHEIHNNYVTPHKLLSTHLISIDPASDTQEFTPNETLKSLPILMEVYKTFLCKTETFRVHELLADAFIKVHRDIGFCYESGKLRIHIPVKTNPEVTLKLDGEEVVMLPGEVWYLDFDLPHEVSNTSDEGRVHLIIDCISNDWWDELMKPFGKSRTENRNRISSSDEEAMKAQIANMDPELAKVLLNAMKEANQN